MNIHKFNFKCFNFEFSEKEELNINCQYCIENFFFIKMNPFLFKSSTYLKKNPNLCKNMI